MRKLLLPFLLGVVFLAVPSAVRADLIFVAYMDGADEVPPNDSPGTGIGVVTLNDTLDQLTYLVAFQDLEANAISAHIHYGDPGVAGPIIFGFPGVPSAPSGTLEGVFTANDFIPVTGLDTYRAAMFELLNGGLYINVHSTEYPSGEIHGQLYMLSF